MSDSYTIIASADDLSLFEDAGGERKPGPARFDRDRFFGTGTAKSIGRVTSALAGGAKEPSPVLAFRHGVALEVNAIIGSGFGFDDGGDTGSTNELVVVDVQVRRLGRPNSQIAINERVVTDRASFGSDQMNSLASFVVVLKLAVRDHDLFAMGRSTVFPMMIDPA